VTASGLIVVDKPGGMTSHDVVARVRRAVGTRKVGHAGTLDPMATGVLVVGVEKATRLLGHLALHDKRYLATVRLGVSTVSDDADGEVVTTSPPELVRAVSDEQVLAAAARLVGLLEQRPSSVSAVKVAGRRAYERVRSGEDVQLEPRSVLVSRLDVVSIERSASHLDVDVDVECSTGTYVRALARDMGADLGVGGHLTRLRRARVGPFEEAEAVSLDDLAARGEDVVMPLSAVAARCFPTWALDDAQARAVSFGQRIAWQGPRGEGVVAALVAPSGDLCALGTDDDGMTRYSAVFA
jgi:tRNA pseudouridine55 synthase